MVVVNEKIIGRRSGFGACWDQNGAAGWVMHRHACTMHAAKWGGGRLFTRPVAKVTVGLPDFSINGNRPFVGVSENRVKCARCECAGQFGRGRFAAR